MTAPRRTVDRSDLSAEVLRQAFCLGQRGELLWRVSRGRCAAGSPVSTKTGHLSFCGVFLRLPVVVFAVANGRMPAGELLFANGSAEDLNPLNLVEVPDEPQVEHFWLALRYEPATGLVHRHPSGERFGADRGDGYLVAGIFGRQVLVHRVVWLLAHGAWPQGVIDHIDGNPSNNLLSNLRDVPQALNCQNRRGARGFRVVERNGKTRFPVSVGLAGKTLYVGSFDDEGEAKEAYVNAKRRLHAGNTL